MFVDQYPNQRKLFYQRKTQMQEPTPSQVQMTSTAEILPILSFKLLTSK